MGVSYSGDFTAALLLEWTIHGEIDDFSRSLNTAFKSSILPGAF